MSTLHDIFNYDDFTTQVSEGLIRVQTHDYLPLSIANYTPMAQYSNTRTPEVESSRGLIFNHDTLEIMSRGFRRFYNWDDSNVPYPPAGPMVLSTKFDGSLGIPYIDSTNNSRFLRFATRGSFNSPQALKATEMLWGDDFTSYFANHLADLLLDGYTPLFEIIYPENRIVVDYKGESMLVLLDVIDNETGDSSLSEFDDVLWGHKAEKNLIPGGFSDAITHTIPSGEEGFVLFWPGSGFRCKMKSAEYVELHRMATGLSKKAVWEWLGQGKTIEDIKDNVPDELFTWVDETVAEFNDAASRIIDKAYEKYDGIMYRTFGPGRKSLAVEAVPENKKRGMFAREAQNFPAERALLFMIFDDREPEEIWKAVWKTLKPVGDTRVWGRGEEESD